MARKHPKPSTTIHHVLEPTSLYCGECGKPMWITSQGHRRSITLQGMVELTLPIRQCRHSLGSAYKRPVRPWKEGAWALPQAEGDLILAAQA